MSSWDHHLEIGLYWRYFLVWEFFWKILFWGKDYLIWHDVESYDYFLEYRFLEGLFCHFYNFLVVGRKIHFVLILWFILMVPLIILDKHMNFFLEKVNFLIHKCTEVDPCFFDPRYIKTYIYKLIKFTIKYKIHSFFQINCKF